jgi:hypothetical protein
MLEFNAENYSEPTVQCDWIFSSQEVLKKLVYFDSKIEYKRVADENLFDLSNTSIIRLRI